MDRETYITKGMREHLGNQDLYRKLTKKEANQEVHIVRYKINLFMSEYKDDLRSADFVQKSNSLMGYLENGATCFENSISRQCKNQYFEKS